MNNEVDLRKVIFSIKNKYGLKYQKEIAEKLEMQNSNLSAIVSGKQKLTDAQIAKFEDNFGVNPDYLRGKSKIMWINNDKLVYDYDTDLKKRIDIVVNEIKGKFGYSNQQDISKILGVDINFFSDLKSGKRKELGGKVIQNLSNIYGINPLFITGDSDELWIKEYSTSINGNNNTNVQGTNNSVNISTSQILENILFELSQQKSLSEQILNNQAEYSKQFTDLLKILSSNK